MQGIARRLEETNALLDRYLQMMARAGRFERLILDERWEGADAVRPFAVSPSPLSR